MFCFIIFQIATAVSIFFSLYFWSDFGGLSEKGKTKGKRRKKPNFIVSFAKAYSKSHKFHCYQLHFLEPTSRPVKIQVNQKELLTD